MCSFVKRLHSDKVSDVFWINKEDEEDIRGSAFNWEVDISQTLLISQDHLFTAPRRDLFAQNDAKAILDTPLSSINPTNYVDKIIWHLIDLDTIQLAHLGYQLS